MIDIFSSGGGTQSCAITALIIQGKLPRPDYIVIADTGRECSQTWKYLDSILKPELSKLGIKIDRIGHEWFSMPSHGKDYIGHNGNSLWVGAWTNLTGKPGKLPGYCSSKWKAEAIDRYLSRNYGITRSKYIKWIGFSTDEWRRAQRIMTSEDGKKHLVRLPLCQDYPLNRQQAILEVKRIGWPDPPRSRCWMCPNQSDDEWRELKLSYPNEFQKAVHFEKEMQAFDPCAWLHKSCVPLDVVDFSKEPSLLDAQYCDSGVCFV